MGFEPVGPGYTGPCDTYEAKTLLEAVFKDAVGPGGEGDGKKSLSADDWVALLKQIRAAAVGMIIEAGTVGAYLVLVRDKQFLAWPVASSNVLSSS